MTDEQREVVRRIVKAVRLEMYDTNVSLLLTMLYEAEGRADRAEFCDDHEEYNLDKPTENHHCTTCGMKKNWDERHTWTSDQWTSAARKRILEYEDG